MNRSIDLSTLSRSLFTVNNKMSRSGVLLGLSKDSFSPRLNPQKLSTKTKNRCKTSGNTTTRTSRTQHTAPKHTQNRTGELKNRQCPKNTKKLKRLAKEPTVSYTKPYVSHQHQRQPQPQQSPITITIATYIIMMTTIVITT